MKKEILLLAFSWLFTQMSAQVADDILFVKDHINFVLANTWTQAQEEATLGEGAGLGLRPNTGVKIGLVYTINLNKRFGLETGSYLGYQDLSYRVQVDNQPDFPLNNFVLHEPMVYFEVPFRAFGRFKLTDKLYSFNYLGFHVSRYPNRQGGTRIANTNGARAMEFNYDLNYSYGMYAFWNIGTGLLLKHNSGDFFRFQLFYHPNMDGSWLGFGEYEYVDPNQGSLIQQGQWTWTGSQIGIEVGYVFSRSREAERNIQRMGR